MFANGTNVTGAISDVNGIADAGMFTANATVGAYAVRATISGLSAPASFSLFNTNEDIRTYKMSHATSPLPGQLVCNVTKPGCTNGADPDADHAEQYALNTYEFYLSHFQRNSVNNAGLPLISSVHYGSNYRNAFWNDAQMVYGDGYSAGLDVVGHELTHGVTQYTSNLFYFYQSGAINESLSDVFGELLDRSYNGGTDSWRIGEKLPGGAIRSMSNPPSHSDPDTMTSSYYYTGDNDSGGVHTNSGVSNKAAYLMAAGGTFNGRTVTALGADKTLAIYYEAQTHLLTSGSDYADLYNALYQACFNLVGGTAGVVDADCASVRNALDAVKMNAQVSSSYNPEASLCSAGLAPVNAFYDGFESGTGKWTFKSLLGTQRWRLDSPYGPFAHSGKHFLYADDYPARITDVAAQMKSGVKVPAHAYLYFAHAYDFEHYTGYSVWYDGGVLEYSTDNGVTWRDAGSLPATNGYRGTIKSGDGNPLGGRKAFVGTSHGYVSTRVDLSSLAGKTVKFRWRMGLDKYGYSWGWWLDDVRIYTCGSFSKSSPVNGADNQNATVTLSWKSASGATSYEYCYDTTGDGSCSDWHMTATISSVSISGLSPSTTYYWQVRANTAGGTVYAGPNWWSFTTRPLPSPFDKLAPANGAIGQPPSPFLNWDGSANATGYEYCYDTVDNDTCDATWAATAHTAVAPTGLALDTTYYWQVRAVNSFGPTEADSGAWSSFATAPAAFALSGNVSAGGAALGFTGSTPDGAVNGQVFADAGGHYTIAIPPDWSGTVTPSKGGVTFTPSSIDYVDVTTDQLDQNYSVIVSYASSGAQDGWILESGENTNQGGSLNAAQSTFKLGDDTSRKQYRGILSFTTKGLPDNAVITDAALTLRKQTVVPSLTNPFNVFQGLLIDVRKGIFGVSGLQPSDFQAVASKSGLGSFKPAPAGVIYTIHVPSAAFPYINKATSNGGVTQLRLRFKLDDNQNAVANYIAFFSGDHATASYRPKLVITYHLP